MFQKHVACTLLGVDANSIVGDDGAGLGRDLELLGGELEHRGEGRRLGHAEHFEGELGVGGEDDLEGHLPSAAAAARRRRRRRPRQPSSRRNPSFRLVLGSVPVSKRVAQSRRLGAGARRRGRDAAAAAEADALG